MPNPVMRPSSPDEIVEAAARLRTIVQQKEIKPGVVVELFERWANALNTAELRNVPGVTFLRLWLRRGTLEPIIKRELVSDDQAGVQQVAGRAELRSFPLGVIGHWPAGNVEIQPILSLTCGLLGGNACLVRVPKALVEITDQIVSKLEAVDKNGDLTERLFIASFDHSREDLQIAMASSVDGAMIWGGEEAVREVRALPFPHWARLLVFGPRVSAAAMDSATWADRRQRHAWCQRIARDVWQFDQQACSSPQTLFLEKSAGCDPAEFICDLGRAFSEENRIHPRRNADAGLTSAICLARAQWLFDDKEHRAFFPASPDWTILVGKGIKLPKPVQGRTLTVLMVDDLMDVVSQFDGSLQTLGLAIDDPQKEEALVRMAGRHGVDRIVKLGRMHVFSSPWDGADVVRSTVRMVRHVRSQEQGSREP